MLLLLKYHLLTQMYQETTSIESLFSILCEIRFSPGYFIRLIKIVCCRQNSSHCDQKTLKLVAKEFGILREKESQI